MQRTTLTIFDDYIEAGTSALKEVWTSDRYCGLIGMFDQIVLDIVASDASDGSALVKPTVSAQLEHSADGIHWVNKQDLPEIDATEIEQETTALPIGFDDGTQPFLAYVRVRLMLVGMVMARVHVKVVATLNDYREGDFTQIVKNYIAQTELAGCVQWFNPMTGLTPAHYGAAEKMSLDAGGEANSYYYPGGATPFGMVQSMYLFKTAACLGSDGSLIFVDESDNVIGRGQLKDK